MQGFDGSIRQLNRHIIEQDGQCQQAISGMHVVERFLNAFGTISSGRDFVLCGNHAFSLQTVSTACELTVSSIIDCCESGCMADAYSLLRKYRDDLFFYLYVMVYDANSKLDNKSDTVVKMGENIDRWSKNSLCDLPIGTVLQAIGNSPKVKEAVQKYNLKAYFDNLGNRLNNYVHSNGVSFYNQSVYAYRGTSLQDQMQALLTDMRFITVAFLFLLALCSPLSISSTDYCDYLDCNMTPPEGSQYWVAPFITEFFRNNIELIDESCLKYLKDNV